MNADADRAVLAGRRILITRDPERAASLRARLEALGADVVVAPVTATVPGDTDALDAAVAGLERFAWVAVTSVNAVSQLRASVERVGASVAGPGVQWAVVGPATRRAVEALGVHVGLEPDEHSAAGLVEAFAKLGPSSSESARVLVPQGDLASGTLVAGLRTLGFAPHVVIAYRVVPCEIPGDVRQAWTDGEIDAVVLAAGSAVREIARQLGARADVAVVAIGEPTAAEARAAGLRVDAVASKPTDDELVEAILGAVGSHFVG